MVGQSETISRDSEPSAFTKVTRIALVLNGLAHGAASVAFLLGLSPLAAEQPIMGRRAGSAGLAAVVMFLFVAKCLPRHSLLIVLPAAFVVSQLTTSSYELFARGDQRVVPPLVVEAAFAAIYGTFIVLQRARGSSRTR
jgi:hypothetical protein